MTGTYPNDPSNEAREKFDAALQNIVAQIQSREHKLETMTADMVIKESQSHMQIDSLREELHLTQELVALLLDLLGGKVHISYSEMDRLSYNASTLRDGLPYEMIPKGDNPIRAILIKSKHCR